jgi:glycosyltransferase involved in cell wall biosynthesis
VFKNKKNPPALILKTNKGSSSLTDRVYTKKLLQEIKDSVSGNRLPNIYLLNSDLTDWEMNALYNHPKVKAHVSFTRGEGFGRPLLEATISGKPMVVSAWSGHVDFLNKDMVTTIGGTLTNVHESAADKFLLKEAKWFQIDYSLAGGTMRDIFDNYKKYLTKSRKHRQYTKDRFTWEHMRDLLSEQLKEADDSKVSPKQVGLELPKLKKKAQSIELPKLKKVK